MEISEETTTEETTEPQQVEEVKEETTTEPTEVVPEVKEEEIVSPLSVEDIVSGQKRTPKGVQKRIDELTKEKYEARREAEYWKEKANKPAPVTQPTSDRPLPPLESDFVDPKEFIQARVAYEDKLDVWKQHQGRSEAVRTQQDKEFSENASKFNTKAVSMRSKYADFDEAVSQNIFVMPVVSEIYASDYGPEIGYYLAKNPAEALRLGKLSPNKIAKEIGKLEVKFSEALTRKTSAAPPPIKPVVGSDAVPKDSSKMTDAEWVEWDKQERMKKLQAKLQPPK